MENAERLARVPRHSYGICMVSCNFHTRLKSKDENLNQFLCLCIFYHKSQNSQEI